jgi:ADP-glucose pyrophosphorylase
LDLYTGRNASVDQQANVHESILWDNVIVERDARVRRAILGDGVCVRAGEGIEDAAIVRAELVAGVTPPAKAPKGYVKGDTFVVPLSQ